MNIAVIMQSPDLGGAEKFMITLMSRFRRAGCNTVVASNRGKFFEQVSKERFKTIALPFILDIIGNKRGLFKSILLLPFAIVFYSHLLWNLRKQKTDLILMSGFSEKLLITFLTVFFRIPVFWIEYGALKTIFIRNFYIPWILYQSLLGIPKKIIVPSDFTKNDLKKNLRIAESKILLVPCGIEIRLDKKIKIPEKLEKKLIIGSVSRLTYEKGQDYLIKAVPLVLEKIPNAYFIIVGDGPDRIRYRSLINELGIHKNVRMIGFVTDTANYYPLFDLFIFPSVWELEGFGLVVVEAMINKIPVIGTDNGPIPEISEDGTSGLIVPARDEKALARAIIRLGQDASLRSKMGKAGYEKAIEKYSIVDVSKKYLDTFNEAAK